MKYCKNCGTILKEESIYCYRCGSRYLASEPEGDHLQQREIFRREALRAERRRRQKSRGRLFLFLLLFVVVVFISVTLMTSSALKVYRFIRTSNVEQAESVFYSEVEGNTLEAFLVRSFAPQVADLVLDDYNEDRITYEEAYRNIELLITMEYPVNHTEARQSALETLKRSKSNFASGEEAEAEGEYSQAMTYYSKVSSMDKDYETAMERAENTATMYKEAILESVSDPESAGEYESAIEVLTAALVVLPSDQDFSERLTTLRQNYASMIKTQATDKATEYIEKGYYSEAISILRAALSYSQNDMQLQTMIATATTEYENFVKDQVEIYLENKDWEGAMELLTRAKDDLPDNAVIEQLYVTTETSEGLYE